MKPSDLLRAAKELIEEQPSEYTCTTMKAVLEGEQICDYWHAHYNPTFLAARNYLWKHRTWDGCEFKDDPYFNNYEERIEGITKAIADAEAAGE